MRQDKLVKENIEQPSRFLARAQTFKRQRTKERSFLADLGINSIAARNFGNKSGISGEPLSMRA